MKNLNLKSVLPSLQLVVCGIVGSAILISLAVLVQGGGLEKISKFLLIYSEPVLTTLVGVILLKTVKFKTESSPNTYGWVVVLSLVFSSSYFNFYLTPDNWFGDMKYSEIMLIENSVGIIVCAISFFYGMYKLRYGVASSLTTGMMAVIFYPYSAYTKILGILILCALAGALIKFIFFTKWSNLVKEENEL